MTTAKSSNPFNSSNRFDAKTILDGIRRWVEIETPTEAPGQVNRLVTLVADGYRNLPVTIERVAGHSGCGDHILARSSWGQDAPGILVLSHLDTVHPMGCTVSIWLSTRIPGACWPHDERATR